MGTTTDGRRTTGRRLLLAGALGLGLLAAGTAAAAAVGELLRGHVIPAPAMDLESVILARPSTTR